MKDRDTHWPALPLAEWADTLATLHRWTQIVGKVRMVESPWINHSWGVTLYVDARGLTTRPIPHGERTYQIDFDFRRHRLVVDAADGASRELALAPRSVADFHRELMATLDEMGLPVRIEPTPNEVEDATPFDRDEAHRSYDPDAVHRFWRTLLQADRVMRRFRSRFLGKSSPVHFFWGSFDLAVTRFSGRKAPAHPGGGVPNMPPAVNREAYSHEVSSAGFWPGTPDSPVGFPAFYAYAYPEPDGFADARVLPADAYRETDMGLFIFPWDAARKAADPEAAILDFLQSTYEAAADLAGWDRTALEREEGRPR